MDFPRDFYAVPVMVDSVIVTFNFGFLDNAYGTICQIHAEGKELLLDRDLYPITGNMPPSWVYAATEKLKELLNYQDPE